MKTTETEKADTPVTEAVEETVRERLIEEDKKTASPWPDVKGRILQRPLLRGRHHGSTDFAASSARAQGAQNFSLRTGSQTPQARFSLRHASQKTNRPPKSPTIKPMKEPYPPPPFP
jgi:hypothetical protein